MRTPLSILAFLGLCHAAPSATFYISPSGDDSRSGQSPLEAWQTASRVNRADFSAGDTILFEGGESFAGPVNFDANDPGTPENPITVGSYRFEEAGRATILAGKGGKGRGIDLYNTGGFHITRLKIVGAGAATNQASGIIIHTSTDQEVGHIRISHVNVSGFGKHGLSLGAWKTKVGYDHVRITHSEFHDNLKTGIFTWGPWGAGIYAHSNIHVDYCRAYNMSGGSGITFSSVDGGIIERSVAYNNGTAFSGAAGIWAWDSNDITIQFNESHNNRTIGVDGDGFDFDGGVTNSVMQYNYSHDNDAAGFLLAQYPGAPQAMQNNVIRYNISENDCRKKGYGAIHVWNGDGPDRIDGIEIYNNTVYLTAPPTDEPSAIAIHTPTTSVAIRNNLFITTGGKALVNVAPGQRKLTFQNNAYWSGDDAFAVEWYGTRYDSLLSWLEAADDQERIGANIVAINQDPLLTAPGTGGRFGKTDRLSELDAYKLRAGSALIARGLNLKRSFGINPGSHDFYGIPISSASAPAIGAHHATGLAQAPENRADVQEAVGLTDGSEVQKLTTSDPLSTPEAGS